MSSFRIAGIFFAHSAESLVQIRLSGKRRAVRTMGTPETFRDGAGGEWRVVDTAVTVEGFTQQNGRSDCVTGRFAQFPMVR